MLSVVVPFSKVTLMVLMSVVAFRVLLLTCTVMLSCSVCPGVRFPRLQVLFSMVGGGVLVMNVVLSGKSSVSVMLVALAVPMLVMLMV